MGLEGQFLKGGETQELTYRLSLRMAKLFSHLGYDPHKVKETVADAYRIRSLFVHGSHLSYREKRDLDKKYGEIRGFLSSLLGYLRVSIIITILIKTEKEELLDLIDDSLFDKLKDDRLKTILAPVREIVVDSHV